MSTKRKPHGKCLAILNSSLLGDDTLEDNVNVISERPPDKKGEKEEVQRRFQSLN